VSTAKSNSAAVNAISVRPRLDYRYDVIQSRSPQFLGVRDDLASALALAEWAADLHRPARVDVYAKDAGRVAETRDYPAEAVATRPDAPPG
jgi:hypothetical protein